MLAELAAHARYPLLLVNDSDIEVEPGYLRAVAAPLDDPGIGLVTCLYRGHAESWAARLEALGIATEFAPSVLVARLLGVAEFALGSTMVFRAETLAPDRRLRGHRRLPGRRLPARPPHSRPGLIASCSRRWWWRPTWAAETWRQAWRHQLRWSRTIRVSRPGGYFGYVVTHATCWALVAFAARQWWAGAAALVARMIAGVLVGRGRS